MIQVECFEDLMRQATRTHSTIVVIEVLADGFSDYGDGWFHVYFSHVQLVHGPM